MATRQGDPMNTGFNQTYPTTSTPAPASPTTKQRTALNIAAKARALAARFCRR